MMLAAIVLSLAVAQEPPPPAPGTTPPPAEGVQAADLQASTGAGQASIEAGLTAFKKRRFGQAEIEFRRALDSDPASPAANFYLGYTYYKIGERKGRNTAEKQKARELFAKAFELDPQFQPVWGQKKK